MFVHLLQRQSRGSNLAPFDLAVAQRQDLDQRRSLLGSFAALDVLHHDPGLAVPGDDHRLFLLAQSASNIGRVSFEVADGFDLRRQLHSSAAVKSGNLSNSPMIAGVERILVAMIPEIFVSVRKYIGIQTIASRTSR